MQNVSKNDNTPQKSIFSYNVYRTNNQQRPHLRPNNNFKMASGSSTVCKDPEILYFNEKICNNPKSKRVVRECSTQTSKTILQLAQNETGPHFDAQNQTPCSLDTQKTQKTKKWTYDITGCKNTKSPDIVEIHESTASYNLTGNFCKKKSSQASTQMSPVCVNQKGTKDVSLTRLRSGSPVRIGLQIEILSQENSNELEPPDSDRMSPDSLGENPINYSTNNYSLENCPYSVASRLSDFTLDGSCHEQDCLFNSANKTNDKQTLTQTFLEKTKSRECRPIKQRDAFTSKSYIENYHHPNYIQEPPVVKPKLLKKSCRSLDLPDNSFIRRKGSFNQQSTFMCPTTASQIKSVMAEIQSANCLIPPMRRGKSTSPKRSGDQRRFESSKKIPYIDQSKSDVSSSTTLINATRHPELLRLRDLEANSECSVRFSDDVLSLITTIDPSHSSFNDNAICLALTKLQEADWRLALRGLADIVEICRVIDVDLIYDYMGTINQRLIDLLKNPRSHVSRTACQAAGHLFEYVKDTRRPTFDEIVDILLQKTADANKFIRHDANMALDCMVTHVSTFNSVRALCSKGPSHKNPLVRCATARLLVCAIIISGPDFILNPNNNEYTRKRIITTMVRLLEDKNLDTRKLAERLYKVLSKDSRFDVYLKKYLEKEQIVKIKKTLRLIHKK